MTLAEWISKYEKEAEKCILLPGFSIYFEEDKGFFCWRTFQGVFEVDHCCTNNIKYMFEIINDMAKARGCQLLRTVTKHNPSAFMRLLKCTPNLSMSGIRENGNMYWMMERKVI